MSETRTGEGGHCQQESHTLERNTCAQVSQGEARVGAGRVCGRPRDWGSFWELLFCHPAKMPPKAFSEILFLETDKPGLQSRQVTYQSSASPPAQ